MMQLGTNIIFSACVSAWFARITFLCEEEFNREYTQQSMISIVVMSGFTLFMLFFVKHRNQLFWFFLSICFIAQYVLLSFDESQVEGKYLIIPIAFAILTVDAYYMKISFSGTYRGWMEIGNRNSAKKLDESTIDNSKEGKSERASE